MNRKDLSKEERELYDIIQGYNPKWTQDKIFSKMEELHGELGQGFEETRLGYDEDEEEKQRVMDSSYEIKDFHPGPDRMGDIKKLVDSLGKAMNLGLGSDKDKPEGIEMYEGFGRDEDWDDDLTNEQKLETLEKELNIGEDDEDRDRFADPEETDEERLERQIDYFNSLRDHVSDSDMGYMQQQDPESLYSQGRDVYNTMIVEALQKRAMQQGNVGAAADMPFDPGSVPSGMQGLPGAYNQNPIEQAAQGLGQGQQLDPAQLEAMAQQEALRRVQMQGAFAQGIGGLPGMTRYPGLGGNKGYTGGSTPFNPYA